MQATANQQFRNLIDYLVIGHSIDAPCHAFLQQFRAHGAHRVSIGCKSSKLLTNE